MVWVYYQKGNCFTHLKDDSAALQEFRKGKGMLTFAFNAPGALDYWLVGTHKERVGRFLSGLAKGEAAELETGNGAQEQGVPVDWKKFWLELYNYKLQVLSERA